MITCWDHSIVFINFIYYYKYGITVVMSRSPSNSPSTMTMKIHCQFLIQCFNCKGKMAPCVIVMALCFSHGFCFSMCLDFFSSYVLFSLVLVILTIFTYLSNKCKQIMFNKLIHFSI